MALLPPSDARSMLISNPPGAVEFAQDKENRHPRRSMAHFRKIEENWVAQSLYSVPPQPCAGQRRSDRFQCRLAGLPRTLISAIANSIFDIYRSPVDGMPCWRDVGRAPRRDLDNLASTCRDLRRLLVPWMNSTYYRAMIDTMLGSREGDVKRVLRGLRFFPNPDVKDHNSVWQYNEDAEDDEDDEYPEYGSTDDDKDFITSRKQIDPPKASQFAPVHVDLTALHWAIIWGRTDIVDFLISYGADVNATTTDDEYKVYVPSQARSDGPIQVMVDPGRFDYDIERLRGREKWKYNSLHIALTYRYFEHDYFYGRITKLRNVPFQNRHIDVCQIIKALVKAGCDLVTQPDSGLHVLHSAIAISNYHVVRFLLEEIKVDIGVADKLGRTASSFVAIKDSDLAHSWNPYEPWRRERPTRMRKLLLKHGVRYF